MSVKMRVHLLAAFTFTFAACASVPPSRPRLMRLTPRLTIESFGPVAAERYRGFDDLARQRVQAFGLKNDFLVLLRIHPSFSAFQKKTGATEHALRAYARHGQIDIVDPVLWTDDIDDIERMIVHEYWHLATLEHLGETLAARLPAWVREGSASVVAGQGTTRMTMTEVSKTPAKTAQRSYAIAHHTCAHIVSANGKMVFKEIFDVLARKSYDQESAVRVIDDMWDVTPQRFLNEYQSNAAKPRR